MSAAQKVICFEVLKSPVMPLLPPEFTERMPFLLYLAIGVGAKTVCRIADDTTGVEFRWWFL